LSKIHHLSILATTQVFPAIRANLPQQSEKCLKRPSKILTADAPPLRARLTVPPMPANKCKIGVRACKILSGLIWRYCLLA
jgi:hypothetical protein